tara:strand:+ start:1642 stop:2193 length:552 start_codon:yes stop_codon:yes gene_type:complete
MSLLTTQQEYYQKNKDKWKVYNERQKENQKNWYLKNRVTLLEKRKLYAINNSEKIAKYREGEKFQKSNTLSVWKSWGLKGNLEIIWERYCNTIICDLCNIELTLDKKITSTRKCMEHNHKTGEFRNIVCHKCNMTKKDIYKNNKTGYTGITLANDKGRIRYRYKTKRYKTLDEALINYILDFN